MADGQGRQYHQRLKLFYLLDYLTKNTDDQHLVKAMEIEKYFEKIDVPVSRKTLQADIHQLQEFGYEIEYDPHKKGYYLKDESREFTLQELRLLIDSVQSSRFITQRKAKKLTQKLKAKASVHKQKSLDNRHSYVANRVRNMNESAFTHISDIHRAIANDYKISFRYFGYTWEKKPRYFRNGEPYVVSPFALLWSDTNYYLYAYDNGTFKHFRVDRMDSIRLVFQKREGKEEFEDQKLTDSSIRVFSMFGGQEYRVKMRFSNHLASVVIDRFGQDAMLIPDGDKHFTLTEDIEVSPQFYGWLCGLGRGVKVIAPAEVVQKMSDYVKGIAEMYEE